MYTYIYINRYVATVHFPLHIVHLSMVVGIVAGRQLNTQTLSLSLFISLSIYMLSLPLSLYIHIYTYIHIYKCIFGTYTHPYFSLSTSAAFPW